MGKKVAFIGHVWPKPKKGAKVFVQGALLSESPFAKGTKTKWPKAEAEHTLIVPFGTTRLDRTLQTLVEIALYASRGVCRKALRTAVVKGEMPPDCGKCPPCKARAILKELGAADVAAPKKPGAKRPRRR